MTEQNIHHRHILLYYFRKGTSASKACKKLCAVYGSKVVKERQCQNWYAKFRSGDFSLENAPRCGRPSMINEGDVKAIVQSNPQATTRKIGEKLHVSHTSIQSSLKQLGYVKKQDLWVPHDLSIEVVEEKPPVLEKGPKAKPTLKTNKNEESDQQQKINKRKSECDFKEHLKVKLKQKIKDE